MKSRYLKVTGLCLIPVILFVICAIIAPGFGFNSIEVVISQSVIPIALGYGIAFTSAAGLFDLSAGSRVILSAAAGAYFASALGLGLPGLILGCVVVSLVAGIVMGICQNVMKIPSLILSLGFVMLFEVVGSRMLGSSSFISVDSSLLVIGKSPYKYFVLIGMAVAFYLVYYHTKFSSQVRLIGENELLAKNMGINAKKITFLAYTIGGAFLGIVGILQICYAGSISSTLSMGSLSVVFQPMMGVMIGTELLVILDNMAVTVVIGELCITILYNMIIGMGLDSTLQNVVLGVFMIVVMGISACKGDIAAWFRRMKKTDKKLTADCQG